MTKKHFLFICAAVLLAGCTSPEQDQQIRMFWMQQYSNVMSKMFSRSGNTALRPARRRTPPMPTAPHLNTTNNTSSRRAAPQTPQLIDVTIETDALPGKAPLADRKRMKRAWDAVQLSNQKTLEDIHSAFGEQVKLKAFVLTANTEKQLKKEALEAADFAAYFARQRDLLAKQEQALTQLMTQNRHSIKQLKQTNSSL